MILVKYTGTYKPIRRKNGKIGLFILAGLALGASFGIFIGAAIGHTALGIGFGAVGGLFIGWFVAAAVIENSKRKNKASDQ